LIVGTGATPTGCGCWSEILPVLAQEPRFALKGGTAINLFELAALLERAEK